MEKKYSILIVDDNENNLKVIGKMLYDQNYKIALAKSGQEALLYVKKSKYDLILLDIMMPIIDGFETCKILKEDPETNPIPVVFLSAKNSPEDIVKGFQLGAVDFITKPFKIEEVLIRISNHIKLTKAQEEIQEKNDALMLMNGKLQEANIKLKEMNDAKDKFFTIISHDLKSPFSSFLSITDNLTKDFHSLAFSDIHDFSKVIHDTANTLYKLLEDLLIWSKTQTGQVPFKPTICNLSEMVNNNIYLHSQSALQKNIELVNNINKDISIFADVNMFNTVLRNAISNSIKYTKKDEDGVVMISSESNKTHVKIVVEDNGVGISKSMMEDIFKLDEQRSTEGTEGERGTGLGLIISKEFVEKNGGEISFESELEKGSKLIFTVPLAIFD
jgi:signal transduction histidine kinase